MTVSLVQHKSAVLEGTSMPVTLDSVPTSGNLLVALVYDVVNDVSFSSMTLTAGWAFADPSVFTANHWVANNANFGESYILYKFVSGDGATVTPVATCTNNTPHAITVFEVTNPGQAFSIIFRQQDSVSPDEDCGEFHLAGGAQSSVWGTDSSHNCLVLMQYVDAGSILATAVGNIGSALSTVSAATTHAWPFSAIHNGIVRAFSELLPVSTTHTYTFGARLNAVSSVVMVGIIADMDSGGGTSPTDIPVTTTVIAPSVSPASFRYTTIKVS